LESSRAFFFRAFSHRLFAFLADDSFFFALVRDPSNDIAAEMICLWVLAMLWLLID
jgi:hypothetical protein